MPMSKPATSELHQAWSPANKKTPSKKKGRTVASRAARKQPAAQANHLPQNDTRYENLMYWKPILPDIDGDLKRLQNDINSTPSCDVSIRVVCDQLEKIHLDDVPTDCEPDFNQFNFWKAPIPEMLEF